MKPTQSFTLIALFAASLALPAFAQTPAANTMPDKIETRIGTLTFEKGFPTDSTIEKLYDEMDFQRAVQAYLWAYPAISFHFCTVGLKRDLGVGYNDVALWDNFADATGLFLTANTTTIYAAAAMHLGRSGPMVIEVPAGRTIGLVSDFWQRILGDMGGTGPDKGQGGKYLVLPPGYQGEVPAQGYFVVRATTAQVYFLTRGIVEGGNVKAAADLIRKVRVYPWSQRDNPPPTRFISASNRPVDTLAPATMAYWEGLASFINENPVIERDRFFVAMVKPLGIEKGKAFNPDDRQRRILEQAVVVGNAMARATLFKFDERYGGPDMTPLPGTHWAWTMVLNADQESEHYSQIDERLHYFYGATYMSPAMKVRKAGPGSAYVQTFRDKTGAWLDGAKLYSLHIPANAPAKDFWSITIYDNQTRSIIQNKTGKGAISSYDKLAVNADGSVDLYFGPTAPAGKENNWVETVADKGWFPYLRLYAPSEGIFDGTWKMPDIELVK